MRDDSSKPLVHRFRFPGGAPPASGIALSVRAPRLTAAATEKPGPAAWALPVGFQYAARAGWHDLTCRLDLPRPAPGPLPRLGTRDRDGDSSTRAESESESPHGELARRVTTVTPRPGQQTPVASVRLTPTTMTPTTSISPMGTALPGPAASSEAESESAMRFRSWNWPGEGPDRRLPGSEEHTSRRAQW